MARITFEYGKWSSMLGYICGQCGTICPFVEGALRHENEIADNGDVCPVQERRDQERMETADAS